MRSGSTQRTFLTNGLLPESSIRRLVLSPETQLIHSKDPAVLLTRRAGNVLLLELLRLMARYARLLDRLTDARISIPAGRPE